MPSYQFNDEAAKGGYQPLPPGEHIVTVIDATEKISKTGNEMIVLELQDDEGRQCTEFLVFSQKAAWKIDTFLKSIGKAPNKGDTIEITPQFCLGSKGLVRVEHEQDAEGKSWPRVGAWLVKQESAPQAKVEQDNIPF
jgi:hypothetical protein